MPAVFSMTQLGDANRIYQRATTSGGGQGAGQGTIPVAITVITSGTIYARCRSAADGTTIVQASWLVTASAASGTLNISGVDARLGWFYLDLSGDGTGWQAGTTAIGMGVLMLMSGQSLMVRMFGKQDDTATIASTGATIPANGRVLASWTDTYSNTAASWLAVTDVARANGVCNSAGAAELLTRLIAASGVNCGLIGHSVGATSITTWQPGQANHTELLRVLALAGGAAEIFWWFQGHGDSNTNMQPATYKGYLDALWASIDTANSFASPAILISSIPNINSTSWGTITAKEVIRKASREWALANGAIPLVFNDIEMFTDGIHPLQTGCVRQARHAYRAVRPYFGLSHGDAGAVMTGGISKSGVNLILPFTLPSGATGLSAVGAAGSRFKVWPYGIRNQGYALDATTPLTIDNGAGTITLKLASDPGAVPIEVVPYGPQDPANDGGAAGIYDDVTDGDGIALGRQAFAASPPLILLVNRDLTVTGGSYGTGKFSNTLTAGYGLTTASMLPGPVQGMTLEAWVRLDSTSASLKVFCGESQRGWIGCQNNNLLCAAGGSTNQTYTSALPTGQWVHVAMVVNPTTSGATMYINGVAQTPFSFATWPANTGLNPFGIRRFGGTTTFDLLAGQLVDEVALWSLPKYAADFTPPAAAYAGTETGLIGLWHLDGDGLNSAA